MLTGAFDYTVKMWDFAGMDAALRPFRTTTPCGSHRVRLRSKQRRSRAGTVPGVTWWDGASAVRPLLSAQVVDVHWSLSGDRYLVVPASSQAKIFDRAGKEVYVTTPTRGRAARACGHNRALTHWGRRSLRRVRRPHQRRDGARRHVSA